MKNLLILGLLSAPLVALPATGEVIIRDDFTIGGDPVNNDNVLNAPIAGTKTTVGSVTWIGTGQTVRFNNPGNVPGGGRAKPDNTTANTSSISQLSYDGFDDPGATTSTLSLDALVFNVNRIRVGFTQDTSNFITNDAQAFFVEVLTGGQTQYFSKNGGTTTQLGTTGDAITSGSNQVEVSIELVYDSLSNIVSGSVTSPTGNATLAPTTLDFTPGFNNLQIDFASLTGTGGNFPYFDNVQLAVVPEPASVALLGVSSLLIAGRRRTR